MWDKWQSLRSQYINLNLEEVIDYEKFSMISIVYNSTKIEGCSLSESDTCVLLDKDITAKGKPLSDHLMVKDHYMAFKFIKQQAKEKRQLSKKFLQEVGSLIMKNTGGIVNTISGNFNTSKGDIRLTQVYVDQKYFSDFHKVDALLGELIQNTNQQLNTVKNPNQILKLAADVHYHIVNIHPFGDGNGRTARMFMNYVQLYFNEPLIKIFTEDRSDYIQALNEAENNENIGVFHDFICTQQTKFFNEEVLKYQKMNKGFI